MKTYNGPMEPLCHLVRKKKDSSRTTRMYGVCISMHSSSSNKFVHIRFQMYLVITMHFALEMPITKHNFLVSVKSEKQNKEQKKTLFNEAFKGFVY